MNHIVIRQLISIILFCDKIYRIEKILNQVYQLQPRRVI